MGKNSALIIILFAITSCRKGDVARVASPPAVPLSTQLSDTSPPASFIAIRSQDTPHPKTLQCNSPVTQGDTLTILMPQPHGDYLLIKYPSDRTYFVVFPSFGDTTRTRQSLMDSRDFRSLDGVSLLVGVTKGIPWVYGQNVPGPLLAQPGKYRVFVGDNLESDFNPSDVHCDVRVVPNRSTP